MLERDLQDYLFANPGVLFPGSVITSKQREVRVAGRRIDLLFEVEGIHYIVELKRDTITRENIGQIFEYYGLMRLSHRTKNFKMILVAPSIPEYRSIPLEEFGIRCQVVPLPNSLGEIRGNGKLEVSPRRLRVDLAVEEVVPCPVTFEDLLPPITPRSLKLSHGLVRDALPGIAKRFPEYEIIPVRIANSNSPDVLCFPSEHRAGQATFSRGGTWWAFSFGHMEEMSKNDIPNISVNTLPWGLDFAINAELQTSQSVMRRKIKLAPERFDQLVLEHGSLHLQAWFKLEHQPRFYHWIPLLQRLPGEWKGRDLLAFSEQSERDFAKLREYWIDWIRKQRPELTERQAAQMERTNRKLNLAWRLVHSVKKEDAVWSMSHEQQTSQFDVHYRKLKPFIDFFQ